MVKSEYKKIIDKYKGVFPSDNELDTIYDNLFDLGLTEEETSEVQEYMDKVFCGVSDNPCDDLAKEAEKSKIALDIASSARKDAEASLHKTMAEYGELNSIAKREEQKHEQQMQRISDRARAQREQYNSNTATERSNFKAKNAKLDEASETAERQLERARREEREAAIRKKATNDKMKSFLAKAGSVVGIYIVFFVIGAFIQGTYHSMFSAFTFAGAFAMAMWACIVWKSGRSHKSIIVSAIGFVLVFVGMMFATQHTDFATTVYGKIAASLLMAEMVVGAIISMAKDK